MLNQSGSSNHERNGRRWFDVPIENEITTVSGKNVVWLHKKCLVFVPTKPLFPGGMSWSRMYEVPVELMAELSEEEMNLRQASSGQGLELRVAA
jgi:hypothetical protein